MARNRMATIHEIYNFMGANGKGLRGFRDEWMALSPSEKNYFRKAVGEVRLSS